MADREFNTDELIVYFTRGRPTALGCRVINALKMCSVDVTVL